MRSGHSFPPLSAGLVMYLTLNLVPVASGSDQSDQSVTIHGSGTAKKIRSNMNTRRQLTKREFHVTSLSELSIDCTVV